MHFITCAIIAILLVLVYLDLIFKVNGILVESDNIPECFGVQCRNNGILNYTTCMCDCQDMYGGPECEKVYNSAWPNDDFALPENLFGCPEYGDASWKQASVDLIINDVNYTSDRRFTWPEYPHYRGPLNKREVRLNFCVKKRWKKKEEHDIIWPAGKYCLYKSHPCTAGMHADSFLLDGYSLKYPSDVIPPFIMIGTTADDTTLLLCCMNASVGANTFVLPHTDSFVTLKSSSMESCQPMPGSDVKEEWFAFLTNQQSTFHPGLLDMTFSDGSMIVSYCFYSEYERPECSEQYDYESNYRGRLNVTSRDGGLECLPWADVLDEQTASSNIFEENYCRKIDDSGPSCFISYDGRQKRLGCAGILYCSHFYIYGNYKNVARYKRISSNVVGIPLWDLVDGIKSYSSSAMHFSTVQTRAPYVQIDLGAKHVIYSVFLMRNFGVLCQHPFKWQNIAIWVHDLPNDFRSYGGTLCWEIEDLFDICHMQFDCVQLISGRYVTLQPYTSALLEYVQPGDTQFVAQEIEVYGKLIECGQYMGLLTGVIDSAQVHLSSDIPSDHLSIHHPTGACTDIGHISLEIDLFAVMNMEGVAVEINGTSKVDVTITSKIQPDFDSLNETFSIAGLKAGMLKHEYFRSAIFARFIDMDIVSSNLNICVKMELIGCAKTVPRDYTCYGESKEVAMHVFEEQNIQIKENLQDELTATIIDISAEECTYACEDNTTCVAWLHHVTDDVTTCTLSAFPINGLYKDEYAIYELTDEQDITAGEKVCNKEIVTKSDCYYFFNFEDQELLYMSSPSYPDPYPSPLNCSWVVHFSKSVPVVIKVIDVHLSEPEPTAQISEILNQCMDIFAIKNAYVDSQDGPNLVLTSENATKFVGSSLYLQPFVRFTPNVIIIEHTACARQAVGTGTGFVVKIAKADCPGCRYDYTTCTSDVSETCNDYPCGYISTYTFPQLYDTEMRCWWILTSSSFNWLSYQFLHFDVPGGDLCQHGYVKILAAAFYPNKKLLHSDWTETSRYCNTNPPNGHVRLNDRSTAIEFVSSPTERGTGFLFRYDYGDYEWNNEKYNYRNVGEYKSVLVVNGLDEFADTLEKEEKRRVQELCQDQRGRFAIYKMYPHKCYFYQWPSKISWNQAAALCREGWESRDTGGYIVGKNGGLKSRLGHCFQNKGSLVKIENENEEKLIHTIIFQQDGKHVFIDIKKTTSDGKLYSGDGERQLYMNWGVGKNGVSAEPDGMESEKCIMMRHLDNQYGRPTWSDVTCEEEYDAGVVCERPLSVEGYVAPNVTVPMIDNANMTANTSVYVVEDPFFMCTNEEIIQSSFICDRQEHCWDGSDELGCDYVCGDDMFHCGPDEDRCIPFSLTCDFYDDCINGTDEVRCVHPDCQLDEWRCSNGQCIPLEYHNDHKHDCLDNSDEIIEGYEWTISLDTTFVFDGATTANIFLTVYGETGSSREIVVDSDSYEITRGESTVLKTNLTMTSPFKIRVSHDGTGNSPTWHMDKVRLKMGVNSSVHVFDCVCSIPEDTSIWWRVRELSVNDPVTNSPIHAVQTYTATVKTGKDGTLNNVYIRVYGNISDTGLFELHPGNRDRKSVFQQRGEDEFSFQAVSLGRLVMVKVYHHGTHLDDAWFLKNIEIQDPVYNESIVFKCNRWLNITVDNSVLENMFMVSNEIEPSYIKALNCPDGMFQCYNGDCIPAVYYCDQVVHCRGPLHEDEPLMCSPHYRYMSCLDYIHNGHATVHEIHDRDYFVTLGSEDKLYNLHCSLDASKKAVLTYIHNTMELIPLVANSAQERQLKYINIDEDGITKLIALADSCKQVVYIDCFHVYEDDISTVLTLVDNNKDSVRVFTNGTKQKDFCKRNPDAYGCRCRRSIKDWYKLKYKDPNTDMFAYNDKTVLPIHYVLVDPKLPAKISVKIGPLICSQALPTVVSFRCRNQMLYTDPKHHCVLEYDVYGRAKGCLDLSHLTNCEHFECPEGYVKCTSGYCIPLHYMCNGVRDCPNAEDEYYCGDTRSCVGSLRCRRSSVCVSLVHVCDGDTNCPYGDDEINCLNSTQNKVFAKNGKFLEYTDEEFKKHSLLASLNLSSSDIHHINVDTFKGMFNLITLDLRDNDIKELLPDIFDDMSRLKVLLLDKNARLSVLYPGAFHGLASVKHLELVHLSIKRIKANTFEGMTGLQLLNLSFNAITVLEENAFFGLSNLISLDLRGNPVSEFYNEVFNGLHSLKELTSELYLLCCLKPPSVEESRCLPKKNEFSSCDDLMRNEVLRGFLWTVGLAALIGNALAMLYRIMFEPQSLKTGNGMLVSNLCVADLCMGVYMIIIAAADLSFRGRYIWNDLSWRGGIVCRFAGVLAFVSTEASGVFLCLITIDRLLTFRFTLMKRGFTRNLAITTCTIIWLTCLLLAILPLMPIDYFDDEFYTKSGVCLALPLTRDRRGGWEYATTIFVFINLLMFVLIAAGQFLIFREIRLTRKQMERRQRRDDLTIARKLFLVVMTNFLCIFPLCVMGLMSMAGFVIDSEVYAWVAVFILPLNSATDPIIYTLSSIATGALGERVKTAIHGSKKTKISDKEEAEKLKKIFDRGNIVLSPQANMVSLRQYVETTDVTWSRVAVIARMLAEILDFLHTLGYVAGPITTDEVLLKVEKDDKVSFLRLIAMPVVSYKDDDISNDIGNLGFLLKRVIRPPRKLDFVKKKESNKLVYKKKPANKR